MKFASKRFRFVYIYERRPQHLTLPADGIVCVCHSFHHPFHNKIASADALMSRRFILA